MIENLTINFEYRGLQYSIKVPTESQNLPYNLAEVFGEVITKSAANHDLVIEQLIEDFNYILKNIDV